VDFVVVVPARLGASRLPEKPLADLHGRPLVVHVLERARQSGAGRVLVATDHPRIQAAVEAAGGEAMLTDPGHGSGSERVAEVVERLGLPDEAVVVNLQGDEPLMPAAVIRQLADALAADPALPMATVSTPLREAGELFDPHVVKVVCDRRGRAPAAADHYHRHIGLYAYRAGFLRRFVAWPPSPLERLESLEQLRALWHGASIQVIEACQIPGPGVDTPEDLARVRRLLAP